jgi:hypothetical protein
VLRDAPHRDRILERLDLDALADLGARIAKRPRGAGVDLLDLLRRPAVLRRIDADASVDSWPAACRAVDVAPDDGDGAAPPRGGIRRKPCLSWGRRGMPAA